MSTRRDFLTGAGAAAGIVFCGCALRDVAQAQQGGGQRLPVMVNGKRVKTIDVHAHCHFREAVALMGDEVGRVLPQTKGAQEHFIVIEERLKGMDAQAIDMEVLSINPFWYRKERDFAADCQGKQ
jgi:aminocarboxymuconate-semialdehyde decarboxylase